MNIALSTITAPQSKDTKAILNAVKQLMDYCTTHPDAKLRHRISQKILSICSNISYLSKSKA